MKAPPAAAGLLGLLMVGCSVVATSTPSPTPTPTPTPSTAATPSPSPTATPSPTVASTPSASPSPTMAATLPATASPKPTLAVGLPSATCINGWHQLAPTNPDYVTGLQILTSYMGLSDPLNVADMRYFVGPDPDNILQPRYDHVQRWYFKATLSTDATYRGRWLVEKRTDTTLGVSAVAPYDTTGWQSPDWRGFEGDGAPQAYPGLPGLWGGINYDFVTGTGDSGFPGLPKSQSTCLAGT